MSFLGQFATAVLLGRTSAGEGGLEALTAQQATALLNSFVGDAGSGGTKGLVPAPAAGDAVAKKFLKADGTWAVPDDVGGGFDGQLAFPAVQNPSADPNTLDDYEEGTFTPTLAFGGGSTGITYANNTGRYTKVGRVVICSLRLDLSNKGTSTGDAVISGLPFTALVGVGWMGYSDGLTPGSGSIPMYVISGTSIPVRALVQSTGSNSSLGSAAFNNSTVIRLTFAYEV